VPRPGSGSSRPRIELGPAFDLGRELRLGQCGDAGGLRRVGHQHQARAQSRQRHQGEGPACGMEFGRTVVVGALVTEIEGEGGLLVAPTVRRDAGGLPHRDRRPSAPIASPALSGAPCASATTTRLSSIATACAVSSITVERGQGPAPRVSSAASMDSRSRYCGTKASSPILARGKMHFRSPQQSCGIVDDAHDAQRRRVIAAVRPDAERIECGHRRLPGVRSCGCRIRRAWRPARFRRPRPPMRSLQVRPAGPAADDDHLGRFARSWDDAHTCRS